MSKKLSPEQQEESFRKIHGDRYSYDWDSYVSNSDKMVIICDIHGEFYQSPANHKKGKGCQKCGYENVSKLKILTFEQTVIDCRKAHGYKYNYFEDSYTTTMDKMKIECPDHGIFYQVASDHKLGRGCPKCKNEKISKSITLPFEEVVKSCRKIHGEKYNYFEDSYINSQIEFKIECKIHGLFYQRPDKHKIGQGCPKCGKLKIIECQTLSSSQFISNCKIIHGDKYNYFEESYSCSKNKMKIECKIHGCFYQSANSHRMGNGCPKCRNELVSKIRKISFDDLVNCFRKVHGDRYNYFKDSHIGVKEKMKMECKIHGFFYQSPDSHKRGSGCPSCSSSKGEESILNYLKINNLIFQRQKTFDDCRFNNKLKFDFYIPSINTCIEYDGEQHNNFVQFWHKDQDGFEFQKHKDKIKNDYCRNNNIRLIRISYLDFNKIDEILNSSLIQTN